MRNEDEINRSTSSAVQETLQGDSIPLGPVNKLRAMRVAMIQRVFNFIAYHETEDAIRK